MEPKERLLRYLYSNKDSYEFVNVHPAFQDSGLRSAAVQRMLEDLVEEKLIECGIGLRDLGIRAGGVEKTTANVQVMARIVHRGEEYVKANYLQREMAQPNQRQKVAGIAVFISHSHSDVAIAKELIELLRSALNLTADQITCTSVDGYRLPAGASTDEQLKIEIHDSDVLIGLISPASITSYYVLFELGARWGANRPLIPLITSPKGTDLLQGPLTGINALSAFDEAQLFQLVTDVGRYLQITPDKPESFHQQVKNLAILCSEGKVNEPDGSLETNWNDYADSEAMIKKHCESEWPDDFAMQLSCIEEQRKAVSILKRGKPQGIADDDFVLIRKKAAEDWPDDFSMRMSQEQQQIEALRKLRS